MTCCVTSWRQNTGQDPERIRRDFDRNFYMDAQQAKEYGMIDEILSKQAN